MDIASLVKVKPNPKVPDIVPGDTVKVSTKIVEGDRERIQVFQGVVISVRHGGVSASFTVRHVAYGIGVERTIPFSSPLLEKVEVVRQGRVRRAKLYYLRGLSGKEVRRKVKRVSRKKERVLEAVGVLGPEAEEVPEEGVVPEPERKEVPEGEKAQAPVLEKKPEQKPVLEEKHEPVQAQVAEPVSEKKPDEGPALKQGQEPEKPNP